MEGIEGYKYQMWIMKPEEIFNAFTPDMLPNLAAREIVKHLDSDGGLLPLVVSDGEKETVLDYDGVVRMIESIIRHYFSLEPNDEDNATTHIR